MFYYVSGELAYKDLNTCVIDCGGVGYKLTVSHITSEALASSVGKRVKLFTYLAVREDGIELFGFASDEERICFNRLTSVSGVGPKVAMSILSVMTPDNLAAAICTEDVKSIAKAPGIGSKTAARIVLELKDKLSKAPIGGSDDGFDAITAVSSSAAFSNKLSDAQDALMALGYTRNEAQSVHKTIDAEKYELDAIIRIALKKIMK